MASLAAAAGPLEDAAAAEAVDARGGNAARAPPPPPESLWGRCAEANAVAAAETSAAAAEAAAHIAKSSGDLISDDATLGECCAAGVTSSRDFMSGSGSPDGARSGDESSGALGLGREDRERGGEGREDRERGGEGSAGAGDDPGLLTAPTSRGGVETIARTRKRCNFENVAASKHANAVER